MKNVFIFLFLLSACLTPPESAFNPAEISCTDVSSEELRIKAHSWVKHPLSDIYFIEKSDHFLRIQKELANQGKANDMHVYGRSMFEVIFIKDMENGSVEGRYLPDSIKEKVVDLLTYMHISIIAEKNPDNKTRYIERLNKIKNRTSLAPKSSWVNEAKYNANKWNNYCFNY